MLKFWTRNIKCFEATKTGVYKQWRFGLLLLILLNAWPSQIHHFPFPHQDDNRHMLHSTPLCSLLIFEREDSTFQMALMGLGCDSCETCNGVAHKGNISLRRVIKERKKEVPEASCSLGNKTATENIQRVILFHISQQFMPKQITTKKSFKKCSFN